MKKRFALAAALCFCLSGYAQNDDPVVMTIDGKDIKRSEFEYIYNKNNQSSEIDKKSLDEYVDLFINFKLKVAEAEAAGIDTTKSFRDELGNYRRQLAKSYLRDKSADEDYVKTIYERMKYDIRASHVLIKCGETDSPADTLAAYEKAMEAYDEIMQGAPFDKVASKYSEDPSVAKNKGDIGYFTALQMIMPFENAAYNMEVGEVSKPVRTRFGYHVIKVTGRRPNDGKVLVAHIFRHIPQNMSKADVEVKKQQMDSIYNAIVAGADFGEMARTFSDDLNSGRTGGKLPWFGRRQTVPEFEDMAFSMKDGEVSAPFVSPIGIHIIKKIDHKPLEPFEEKKGEIENMLYRFGLDNKGEEVLIARLSKEYGLSPVNEEARQELIAFAPGAVIGDEAYLKELGSSDKTLFTLAGKEYTQQDFGRFVKDYTHKKLGDRETAINNLLKVFRDKCVLDYEDSQLENKYPSFANLMQEYRDGILLFDISNQMVWDKASTDIEGIEEFFKKNKKNYKWDTPHFRGIVVHCKSDSVEKPLKKLFKETDFEKWASDAVNTFNKDSVKVIQVEKGIFVKGDNKYVDYFKFKGETFEQPKDYPYTFVYGKMLKKGPEKYTDMRGPVAADYQNYLEKEWVESLREKYKDRIVVYKDVLKTVNNHK